MPLGLGLGFGLLTFAAVVVIVGALFYSYYSVSTVQTSMNTLTKQANHKLGDAEHRAKQLRTELDVSSAEMNRKLAVERRAVDAEVETVDTTYKGITTNMGADYNTKIGNAQKEYTARFGAMQSNMDTGFAATNKSFADLNQAFGTFANTTYPAGQSNMMSTFMMMNQQTMTKLKTEADANNTALWSGFSNMATGVNDSIVVLETKLQEQIDLYNEIDRQLAQSMSSGNANNVALTQQLAQAQQTIAKLQTDMNTLRSDSQGQMTGFQSSLAAIAGQQSTLQGKYAGFQSSLSSQQASLSNLINSQNESVAQLQAQIATMQANIATLRPTTTTGAQAQQGVEASLQQLTNSLAALQAQTAQGKVSQDATIQSLTDQLNAVKRQVASLAATPQTDQLKNQVDGIASLVSQLQTQVATISRTAANSGQIDGLARGQQVLTDNVAQQANLLGRLQVQVAANQSSTSSNISILQNAYGNVANQLSMQMSGLSNNVTANREAISGAMRGQQQQGSAITDVSNKYASMSNYMYGLRVPTDLSSGGTITGNVNVTGNTSTSNLVVTGDISGAGITRLTNQIINTMPKQSSGGGTVVPGPKGDTGAMGPKGDTGAQGPKGDKGDTGAQGSKGDKGDTGIQGVAGRQGDRGAQGVQGIPGAPGQTGPIGQPGAQGPAGPAGPAANIGLDPKLNSISRDDTDWLRIKGTPTNGTAMYNGVSINEGGLTIGKWGKSPNGQVTINNVDNSETLLNADGTNWIRGKATQFDTNVGISKGLWVGGGSVFNPDGDTLVQGKKNSYLRAGSAQNSVLIGDANTGAVTVGDGTNSTVPIQLSKSWFPWSDGNTYIRAGQADKRIKIGDVDTYAVEIGNKAGTATTYFGSGKICVGQHCLSEQNVKDLKILLDADLYMTNKTCQSGYIQLKPHVDAPMNLCARNRNRFDTPVQNPVAYS
jgi:Collagen triple helix repeat (20 copies)